jgi:hypothetical protein
LFGVGLDADDGQHRITHADDALLVGGSEETHDRMQETVVKLNEALGLKGKRTRDASAAELADLIRGVQK